MNNNRPLISDEIEDYINWEIENKYCSETEDNLEKSEHETNYEQIVNKKGTSTKKI